MIQCLQNAAAVKIVQTRDMWNKDEHLLQAPDVFALAVLPWFMLFFLKKNGLFILFLQPMQTPRVANDAYGFDSKQKVGFVHEKS